MGIPGRYRPRSPRRRRPSTRRKFHPGVATTFQRFQRVLNRLIRICSRRTRLPRTRNPAGGSLMLSACNCPAKRLLSSTTVPSITSRSSTGSGAVRPLRAKAFNSLGDRTDPLGQSRDGTVLLTGLACSRSRKNARIIGIGADGGDRLVDLTRRRPRPGRIASRFAWTSSCCNDLKLWIRCSCDRRSPPADGRARGLEILRSRDDPPLELLSHRQLHGDAHGRALPASEQERRDREDGDQQWRAKAIASRGRKRRPPLPSAPDTQPPGRC